MKKENMHNLFKPFMRGDDEDKYNVNGCGLGLMICKLIVEKFNGEIQIESEKNEGTKVMFTLKISPIL